MSLSTIITISSSRRAEGDRCTLSSLVAQMYVLYLALRTQSTSLGDHRCHGLGSSAVLARILHFNPTTSSKIHSLPEDLMTHLTSSTCRVIRGRASTIPMRTTMTNPRHSFLLLPFEVRRIIYSHLFANATTTIHDVAPYYYLLLYTDEQIQNYTGPERFDQCAYLPVSQRCHSAILYVDKQVHAEARLALVESLHLRFAAYPFEAVHVPPALRAYMASIKHVTIGQRGNTVPDVDMSLFPGLELLEIDVAIRKSRSTYGYCDDHNCRDYYNEYCNGSRHHGYEVEFFDRQSGIQAASVFHTTPDSTIVSEWKYRPEEAVMPPRLHSTASLHSQISDPSRGYRILFSIAHQAGFLRFNGKDVKKQTIGHCPVWLKFDVNSREIVCRRILDHRIVAAGLCSLCDGFEHIYAQ